MKHNKIKMFVAFVSAVVLTAIAYGCYSDENGLIYKNYQDSEERLISQYPDFEVCYEHSYITEKDCIININESEGNAFVYVSLGKPEDENGINYGSSFVKENRNKVYIVNNESLSVVENGKCKVTEEFDEQHMPYLFDVYKDGIVYRDEANTTNLYRLNYKDNKVSILASDLISYTDDYEGNEYISQILSGISYLNAFFVVNDHVFYKSNDKGLYRMTINGNEKTLLTPDMKIFNAKYLDGWIYFMSYDYYLYKIKPDGSSLEMIADGTRVKNYEFNEANEQIIIQTVENQFNTMSDNDITQLQYSVDRFTRQKGLDRPEVEIVGFHSNELYLYLDSVYSDRRFIICINTKDDNLGENIIGDNVFYGIGYLPRLLDDSIYYYNLENNYEIEVRKLCRRNILTNTVEIIGGDFREEGLPI